MDVSIQRGTQGSSEPSFLISPHYMKVFSWLFLASGKCPGISKTKRIVWIFKLELEL